MNSQLTKKRLYGGEELFTEGEPEFCSAEHKTSYLSMLMRIDLRYLDFWHIRMDSASARSQKN